MQNPSQSHSEPMIVRSQDTDELMTHGPRTESSRRLQQRLFRSALTSNDLGRGGLENASLTIDPEEAEDDHELAEANMQAQILESAQRLCFWVGLVFHSSVLATGWTGWAVWHNDKCDKPFDWCLFAQNTISSVSLMLTVVWRILKVRHPDKFEDWKQWKLCWERINNLTLFSLFVTVMVFRGTSKECDSGIKDFAFWYFLIVVIIFPAFVCCGVCGLIFVWVWISNKAPMGQTLDTHIVDEMEVVQEKDLTENERESGCCICQDKYDDEETIIRLLCGHVFHKECVKEWLTKFFDTCPLCRESQTRLKELRDNPELAEENANDPSSPLTANDATVVPVAPAGNSEMSVVSRQSNANTDIESPVDNSRV